MGNQNDAFKKLTQRTLDQLVYSLDPQEESPFFPEAFHIEPTNACNLSCVHCHHHLGSRQNGTFTRKMGLMDMALYQKITDEIALEPGSSVTLNCQGEPTLHPGLLEMILQAKKKGLRVSLLTNGVKLAGDLAEGILESGLDRIVFSFDAVDKALYESIRVHGDFERVFKNIHYFINENHRRGHGIFICMSIIVQDMTKDHLETYKSYFKDKPVDAIFESHLLNLSGGSGIASQIDLKQKQALPKKDWPVCRIPWENMVINWDGLVTVCPLDFNCKFVAGDANKSALREIWNSDGYRRFRRAHLKRTYEDLEKKGSLCSQCNCLWDKEYDLRNYKDFAREKIVRFHEQSVKK